MRTFSTALAALSSLLLAASLRAAVVISGTGVTNEWNSVVNHATNLPPSDSAARVVATNDFVYVAGTTSQHGNDYFAAQYTTNGTLVWMSTYNGSANGSDQLVDMAVDRTGRVVVTGNSQGTSDMDVVTVQFSAGGATQWVARFTGSAVDDSAVDLALDPSNNVFVTGVSGSEMATFAYSSSGATQWVARYSSGGAGAGGVALAADPSGNAIAVGTDTIGDFASSVIVALKYGPSGTPLWTNLYNRVSDDFAAARDVAAGTGGVVYVTGQSTGDGTAEDIVTLAFSAAGATQWVARFDGPVSGSDSPAAIAVDEEGSVIVAGTATDGSSQSDYIVLKYSAAGALQWDAFGGYAGAGPALYGLALRGNSAVFLAGEIYHPSESGTLSLLLGLDGTGGVVWAAANQVTNDQWDAATDVSVGSDGDLYAAGRVAHSDILSDGVLERIDPLGATQWLAYVKGPGLPGDDHIIGVVADGFDNVIVTGLSYDQVAGQGVMTIKYNSSGVTQWINRVNAVDVVGVGVDGSGRVTIATSVEQAGVAGTVVIQYGPSGATQWVDRIDGVSALAGDYPGAIAVATNGDIFVAGLTYDGGANSVMTLYKLNSSGATQWFAFYDGAPGLLDYARAVAIGPGGAPAVAGNSWGGAGGTDLAVVQFSSSGATQWVGRYDGAGYSEEVAGLVIDRQSNVFVTGSSFTPATGTDFVTIKYSPSGATQWIARLDGPQQGVDAPAGVAVDSSGNAYVTGYISTPSGYDFATVRYNASGSTNWLKRYNGPDGLNDTAYGIVIDRSNRIVVAGTTERATGGRDAVCIRYTTSGTTNWIVRYDGGGTDDELSQLAVSPQGYLAAAGRTVPANAPNDYLTMAFSQSSTLSGYDIFAQLIPNPALRGEQMDPDGDGYPNLLEYATGGSPTNADAIARMSAVRTNGLFAFRFSRNPQATDAEIVVEQSDAVTNSAVWTGIATNFEGTWTGSTNVSETGANPVSVTVADPMTGTNTFMRLHVMRP